VAVRGVFVQHAELHDHGVDRKRPGVVRHEQRRALGRDVLQTHPFRPPVPPVQLPDGRGEHLLGQLGVEPELVDVVLPGGPPRQEGEEVPNPVRVERPDLFGRLGGLVDAAEPVLHGPVAA